MVLVDNAFPVVVEIVEDEGVKDSEDPKIVLKVVQKFFAVVGIVQ